MIAGKGKCKEDWIKHYGTTTVSERGQIVLPAEARKRFGIEAGEKLLVLGSEAGGFERIILMKSEAITGLLNHMLDIRETVKKGGAKTVEKMLKEGIDKTRSVEKIVRKTKGK